MITYTARCNRTDGVDSDCSQQSPARTSGPSWCSTMGKHIPAPCADAQGTQGLWDWQKSSFLFMLPSSCPAHTSRTLLSFRNESILVCVRFITENHTQSKSVVNHMGKKSICRRRDSQSTPDSPTIVRQLVWGGNGAKRRLQHVQCSHLQHELNMLQKMGLSAKQGLQAIS